MTHRLVERGGRPAHAYRLTSRGADLLAEFTGRSASWIAKHDPRPETLHHRIGMAKLRLQFNDACTLQGLAKPEWISEYDTAPNTRPDAKLNERFRLCERLSGIDGKTAVCWADASCWLKVPHPDGGAANLLIYWEYDRSTEALKQVARKVAGYYALLTAAAYRKHWPQANAASLRVFFVAVSEERIRNVIDAIKNRPGASLFRFATVPSISSATILTHPLWRTISGECREILRLPRRLENGGCHR